MSISRLYRIPSATYFLFGPRGVGKSTWVRQNVHVDLEIDLLSQRKFLQLQRDAGHLEALTAPLPDNATVFIDEIQKLPELLDEVHRLIESRSLNFVLTGSSARKLRRAGANLLGGRAHTYKMFPFSLKELADRVPLQELAMLGTLPRVVMNLAEAEETLISYVETYLREEIREEALVRRVDEFARFLEVSGRFHAQVLNFQNVAREAGKSASTIQSWYQILEETLLGTRLVAYRPGFKVREVEHPKFYWFDPGVARIAAGQNQGDVDSLWLGFAFETHILNEILIRREVSRGKEGVFYYGSPSGGEIDFIVETRKKTINRPAEFVSIEVKQATKWKREFEGPSRALKSAAGETHKRMMGVYQGSDVLSYDGFEVYPVPVFVDLLHRGELF